MGVRNILIEGVSGTGKTSVASGLQQRGCHVVHGDRELAYQGDPVTGEPLSDAARGQGADDIAFGHRHHVWDVDKVKALVADQSNAISFFCGGSRNFDRFIHLFDQVFVLDVDPQTLMKRLATRPHDEFGASPAERQLVLRLHATKEDIPSAATIIDATAPLACVIDDILARCAASG
jgi:broad-specificity NMP kinase